MGTSFDPFCWLLSNKGNNGTDGQMFTFPLPYELLYAKHSITKSAQRAIKVHRSLCDLQTVLWTLLIIQLNELGLGDCLKLKHQNIMKVTFFGESFRLDVR